MSENGNDADCSSSFGDPNASTEITVEPPSASTSDVGVAIKRRRVQDEAPIADGAEMVAQFRSLKVSFNYFGCEECLGA